VNTNPLYWHETLRMLGDAYHCSPGRPGVGVPVAGDACPPSVRVPLRAVLRQAFLAGHREAPLLDALADVEGWTTGRALSEPEVQILIPVRGAHEALGLALRCLDAHTEGWKTDALLIASKDEIPALQAVVEKAVPPSPTDDAAFEEEMHKRLGRGSFFFAEADSPQSFAANVNLGASRACSDFLVLLNSDAYVGPGWLEALLAPFEDPEVAAVGPMGTNVSGHQNIPGLPWDDPLIHRPTTPADVAEGAVDFAARSRPGPYPARRLVGFCVAVRRSAWDRVGGMDERFANAYCDDDLALRLSLVGKCVVVPDLLVLHEGQASFRELQDAAAAYDRALAENRDRFAKKWGWLLPDWNAWNDSRGWK
jgi:hypothetical protein